MRWARERERGGGEGEKRRKRRCKSLWNNELAHEDIHGDVHYACKCLSTAMTSRKPFSVHLIGLCVNWRKYGRVYDFHTLHQSHGKSLFLLKFDVPLIGINIPASVSIVVVVVAIVVPKTLPTSCQSIDTRAHCTRLDWWSWLFTHEKFFQPSRVDSVDIKWEQQQQQQRRTNRKMWRTQNLSSFKVHQPCGNTWHEWEFYDYEPKSLYAIQVNAKNGKERNQLVNFFPRFSVLASESFFFHQYSGVTCKRGHK